MKIRELMTSDVTCASPSDNLTTIAAGMKRHNVGIMPVCEGNKLVGVITDRDIVVGCIASGTNPGDCIARSFMTTNPVCGTPDMDIQQAVELMSSSQIHRLPILEKDRLVGIVSVGDLAVHLQDSGLLSQLLRDISTPVRSATENVRQMKKAA